MQDHKLKYVKLTSAKVIIFPFTVPHSMFQNFVLSTAGYCSIDAEKERVYCFGISQELGLKSDMNRDSLEATGQFFGIHSKLKWMKSFHPLDWSNRESNGLKN
ncbi:hypothetical protein BH11BAC5_BH11BAC5_48620 [soil metagenome]